MRVETQLAVGNGGAKAEGVKVPDSHVTPEEDRVRSVQRHRFIGDFGNGVGIRATEPLCTRGIGVDRDVLCVVELDHTVDVRVGRAVEGADVDVGWWSVDSVRREELVHE